MSHTDEREMVRRAVSAVRLFIEAERENGFLGLATPWRLGPASRAADPSPQLAPAASTASTAVEEVSSDRARRLKTVDPESRLRQVRDDLGDCKRCKLAAGRKNLVFGVGNPRAELLFIGEAPGADEDRQGIPFVGKAGQLLTKIIRAMGLSRDDVYICNIIKCRPPENRDPEGDEIAQCEPFLVRQVEAIGPKVIVTLGRFAAQSLLQTSAPISRIRGRWHQWRGVPVMPTYHPAYLLRSPEQKRPVWEDMQDVMKRLGLRPNPSSGS
ncbi:MAG: uracil-DNA glycosylase [Myxococcales bacterium]|nr:uracil-DNA glycosylase [Myxococcales bacterium]